MVAFADLSGLPVSQQLVDSALGDLLPRRTNLQTEDILRRVAEVYGVTVERLLSRDRSQQVALPRQVAMYLLREEANISLPQIGEALGGRDHTTILYGCEKIADLVERDERFRRRIVEIKEQIYNPRPY